MNPRPTVSRRALPGTVRIIGGSWRGRKLPLPAAAAVRPTPDRVRETLFNWLMPLLPGARCLDLFAGSGVLGLEALSRGAAHAVLVDQDAQVSSQLRAQVERLGAAAEVLTTTAESFIANTSAVFDLVFVDPPYGSGLLAATCDALAGSACLAPGARLYLEDQADAVVTPLPAGWTQLRAQRAGQVAGRLVRVGAPA